MFDANLSVLIIDFVCYLLSGVSDQDISRYSAKTTSLGLAQFWVTNAVKQLEGAPLKKSLFAKRYKPIIMRVCASLSNVDIKQVKV